MGCYIVKLSYGTWLQAGADGSPALGFFPLFVQAIRGREQQQNEALSQALCWSSELFSLAVPFFRPGGGCFVQLFCQHVQEAPLVAQMSQRHFISNLQLVWQGY